eukprot:3237726-Pleurochrysis_carterae.AAC.2
MQPSSSPVRFARSTAAQSRSRATASRSNPDCSHHLSAGVAGVHLALTCPIRVDVLRWRRPVRRTLHRTCCAPAHAELA